MSLSLAILLIVGLDAALIGLLAFVMSRASRLSPHTPVIETTTQPAVAPAHPQRATRIRRSGRPAPRTASARS